MAPRSTAVAFVSQHRGNYRPCHLAAECGSLRCPGKRTVRDLLQAARRVLRACTQDHYGCNATSR